EAMNNLPVAPAPDWFAEYLKPRDHAAVDQIAVVDLDQPHNIKWAADWLRTLAPPAVQGQAGEKTLFDVAATLKDHAISKDTAIDLLRDFYNSRCSPEWSI